MKRTHERQPVRTSYFNKSLSEALVQGKILFEGVVTAGVTFSTSNA